ENRREFAFHLPLPEQHDAEPKRGSITEGKRKNVSQGRLPQLVRGSGIFLKVPELFYTMTSASTAVVRLADVARRRVVGHCEYDQKACVPLFTRRTFGTFGAFVLTQNSLASNFVFCETFEGQCSDRDGPQRHLRRLISAGHGLLPSFPKEPVAPSSEHAESERATPCPATSRQDHRLAWGPSLKFAIAWVSGLSSGRPTAGPGRP